MAIVVMVAALAACGSGSPKPDQEALRNTYACDDAGERVVIRFDRGEARLLFPNGERVNLYEVPSAAGPRYTNGTMDLYGKTPDLKLAREGGPARALGGCANPPPPP